MKVGDPSARQIDELCDKRFRELDGHAAPAHWKMPKSFYGFDLASGPDRTAVYFPARRQGKSVANEMMRRLIEIGQNVRVLDDRALEAAWADEFKRWCRHESG